ncbi:hypothetical protein QC818_10850 [Halomonas koreensis]|uniref:Phage lysis regulatory protein, LysB family n=1 Tax=Halomonas koreensis TaxID=245385 RepID=A0ABU1G411_9GAMM|nr:hypothetical protein [Halomonas koreensis]MDR5867288.1 hypothetical protein [Halomonas koreensis]
MIRLLRLIPGWVWAALLAVALAGGGWLYLQGLEAARNLAAAERDAAQADLERTQGEVAALTSALEWRRENARNLLAALEQREQALADARETIRGHLEALDRLEEDDAEVGDWAAQPLPDAVARWLRQLGAADGAGAGDADGAAEPDQPPPASRRDGRNEPGAAGPAR